MAYRNIILKDDPSRYYRFGDSAGTSALDETGAGNGTYSGGVALSTTGLIADDADTSVAFDAVDGLVTIPTVLSAAAAPVFSLEFWTAHTETTRQMHVFDKDAGTNTQRIAVVLNRKSDGTTVADYINVLKAVSGSATNVSTSAPVSGLSDGLAHHVVVTVNDNVAEIYVDGISRAVTGALDAGIAHQAATNHLLCAQQTKITANKYTGTMDEPALYGRVLTASEVMKHYYSGLGKKKYPLELLAGGPTVYYRFGEAAGTVAEDETVNIDGTYVGGVTLGVAGLLPTDVDTAIGLDGSTGYVSISNSGSDFDVTTGNSFTIEAWVYLDTLTDSAQIYGITDSTSNNLPKQVSFKVGSSSKKLLFAYRNTNAGSWTFTEGTTVFAVGTAYHTAVTYDGTTVRVYVNGVQEASSAESINITLATTEAANIGRLWDGTTFSSYLDGTVDEFAYYKTALTADDIFRHYEAGLGYEEYALEVIVDKPTGYWRLGEPAGSLSVVDEVGSATGTVVGNPTFESAPLIVNDSNRAILFDGVGDYINFGDVNELDAGSTDFTMEAWVSTTAATSQVILDKRQTGGSPGYALYLANGVVTVLIRDASGTTKSKYDSTAVVNDGSAHHIMAVVHRGTESAEIYVDGVEGHTVVDNLASGSISSTASLIIGHKSDTGSALVDFNGTIDEVSVYINKALTATDATTHYLTGLYASSSSVIVNEGLIDTAGVSDGLVDIRGFTDAFLETLAITTAQGDSLAPVILSLIDNLHVNMAVNSEQVMVLLENAICSDSVASGGILSSDVADNIALSDITAVVYDMLAADGITFSDTSPSYVQRLASIADALVVTGLVDNILKAVGVVADAAVFQAAIDRFFDGIVSDTLDVSSAIVLLHRAVASAVESVVFGEASGNSLRLAVISEDGLVGSDSSTPSQRLVAALQDGLRFVGTLQLPGAGDAWVVNTMSLGLSEYVNYDFNSFATLGQSYLGATADGIYELVGADDDGTDIDARFRTGLLTLGTTRKKRVPEVLLGYTADGNLVLKTTTTEGGTKKEYWYELTESQAASELARVKHGKGLKGTYWQFEVSNVAGSNFDVDIVQLHRLVLSRRV